MSKRIFMPYIQTRRRFLTALSAAGAAGLIRTPRGLAGEERLETTSVRFMRTPSICDAPEFVVEELLRAEGFTDIRYVEVPSNAEADRGSRAARWISFISSARWCP